MYRLPLRLTLCLAPAVLNAATFYVSLSGSHQPPFDTWEKAATNIQAAVNAAANGDTVLVNDGVYTGTVQYLVVISNNITLRSVNGPEVTIIDCKAGTVNTDRHSLWIQGTATGAVVSGFALQGCYHSTAYGYAGVYMQAGMITNCIIRNNLAGGGNYSGGIRMTGGLLTDSIISNNVCIEWQIGLGGGIWMSGGTVERCLIVKNESRSHPGGAGVYMTGGLLRNCIIAQNQATFFSVDRNISLYLGKGGGVRQLGGRIENCTIADNYAVDRGGGLFAEGGSATNLIVANNRCSDRIPVEAWDLFTNTSARLGFVLTSKATGPGFVYGNPLFSDTNRLDYSLLPGSPAIDKGTNLSFSIDFNRNPRPLGSGWDLGAIEMPASADRPFSCGFDADQTEGFDSLNVAFWAELAGANTNATSWRWDFGDGSISNGPNLSTVSHAYGPGWHTVTLIVTNELGETAAYTNIQFIKVHPSVLYVDKSGSHTFPFETSANAATNIESAVAVAAPGAEVRVGDGLWAMARQVAIEKPLRVRSVNGPSFTTSSVPGQVRSFYLFHSNAIVEGFTLTTSGNGNHLMNGAGIYLLQGQITNCIFRNITIGGQGAAIWMAGGLVSDCLIVSNRTYEWQYGYGAGIYIAPFSYFGPAGVENCRILDNLCESYRGGGGIWMARGTVRNCLIVSNRCTRNVSATPGVGGGVYMTNGLLENCTIVSNYAYSSGGGVYMSDGGITNSILYFNFVGAAPAGERNLYQAGGSVGYSCVDPAPVGGGNISLDPKFISLSTLDLHLAPDSPCVDSGTNQTWMANARDLDGAPRIRNQTVDMGCYERPDPWSGPLICNFSATPNDAFLGTSVVFTAEPVGLDTNIVYYWWTFGNGQTEEGPGKGTVTHYYEPGYYDVTLVMQNQSGEIATNQKTAYIKIAPPIAYVATNGQAIAPYVSWEKAARTIQDALGTVRWGPTGDHTLILISNGTYAINAQIVLATNYTLVGVSDHPSNIVLQGSASRLFTITSPGVTLAGLTLQGGYEPSHLSKGGGISMSAGLVSNCIIRSCYAGGFGGGIHMTGGTVTHCLITTNWSQEWQHGRGGGVNMEGGVLEYSILDQNRTTSWLGGGGLYLAGGIARNCLVLRNTVDCYNNNNNGDGGGVTIAGGTLQHVTIVNNWAEDGGGGLNVLGGSVTNCIVFFNTASKFGDSMGLQDIEGPQGSIGYTASPDLTNGVNGNITADPLFVDALAGDYRLQRLSPCIDAGIPLPWITTETRDLDGRPRLLGKRPDMGVYEGDAPRAGTLLIVR